MFNKNIKILIICLLAIFIVLLAVYLFLKPREGVTPPEPTKMFNPPPITSPSTNPQPSIGPIPGHSYTYSSPKDVEERLKQETVRRLEYKLPFVGNNFVLSYDSSSGTFYATINSLQSSQGNLELDNYLKTQGILNRSWIINLIVR